MYIRISLLVFLGIGLFCGNANSQVTSTNPVPKLTPQGAEVSASNKFIDMSVSLYTGVPDISIPIYEIKLMDITIPISLDYHSSGIKVDEPAPNNRPWLVVNRDG